VIQGLLLTLAGLGLIVALVIVLRSSRIRGHVERANASLRSLLRLQPVEQETFVRQFEVGIYFGLCFGSLLMILGMFVAVD
jgi:hypothetical protein